MEIARTLSNLLINFWASRGDSNMAAINAFFEKTTSITLITNCVSVERDPSNRDNEPSVVDGLAAQRCKSSLHPRHTYNSIAHSLGKNGDINRVSLAIFRCVGCGLGHWMKRVIGGTARGRGQISTKPRAPGPDRFLGATVVAPWARKALRANFCRSVGPEPRLTGPHANQATPKASD